jgi:hypothetical protein
MPYARDQESSAQTNTSLVVAPGAGKQIVVKSMTISTAGAQTVLVESGNSTLRWEIYMPATSTETFFDPAGLFRCAGNEALTYTTTASAAFSISVRYENVLDTGE